MTSLHIQSGWELKNLCTTFKGIPWTHPLPTSPMQQTYFFDPQKFWAHLIFRHELFFFTMKPPFSMPLRLIVLLFANSAQKCNFNTQNKT